MLCFMQTGESEGFFCHFGFPLLVGSFWCVMPLPVNILQNNKLQSDWLFSILISYKVINLLCILWNPLLWAHFPNRPFVGQQNSDQTKNKVNCLIADRILAPRNLACCSPLLWWRIVYHDVGSSLFGMLFATKCFISNESTWVQSKAII